MDTRFQSFVVCTLSSAVPVTRFIQSLYHTPTGSARAVFCTVVRAGQGQSGPEHRFDKVSPPGSGTDSMPSGPWFCAPAGRVRAGEAGQRVWVNCHHPPAYGPDPAAPWDHWWLRRERIRQAKRRLAETNAPMKQVAPQTGYRDPFFLSQDFKRRTGLTPTDFRWREQGVAGTPPP